VQEETTILGVPCLTLRENTERPVTLHEGTNVLVGSSEELILAEVAKILAGQGKQGQIPTLWDGQAAIRIAETLQRL
jgi:UDP-N-acetylglucosamine 2-epimerase (non-hydrolysing)